MFDLKRPCINCPFRKGQGSKFRLRGERLAEICNSPSFQCHKTVVYGEADDGEESHSPGAKPQHCAGLAAVLHRMNWPNQIMRIAERIGSLDCATLDPDNEAYATWAEVLRAHKKGREP